ncbi:MAG: DUF5606 domain-containing protein [Cyclobacteriaceae bacterium]
MEFSDLASVAGKGGLYKVFKPTRSGVILESMTDGSKLVVGPNAKVSVLAEISIYTTSEEGTAPLQEVMQKIHKEFGDDTGLTGSADGEELKAFLKHILPDYDEERVYTSDIKKLVNWYNFLVKEAPEVLKEEKKEEAKKKKEEPKGSDEEKPKKKTAKKDAK